MDDVRAPAKRETIPLALWAIALLALSPFPVTAVIYGYGPAERMAPALSSLDAPDGVRLTTLAMASAEDLVALGRTAALDVDVFTALNGRHARDGALVTLRSESISRIQTFLWLVGIELCNKRPEARRILHSSSRNTRTGFPRSST